MEYQKTVRAVTIEVPTELGMTVLTTLQNIYSPDKRKDLPLDRRYALYANGGDPHVSLRGSSLEVLEKARELQKNYIRSVATMQLEDCIKDPNAPVYGGGPPLRTIVAGLKHPKVNCLLILGMDKTRRNDPDDWGYTFTYPSVHDVAARELISKLYMFMKAKYGLSAKGPFSPTFIARQENNFTITPEGILSKADRQLATAGATTLSHWAAMEFLLSDEEEEEDHHVSALTVDTVKVEEIRVELPGSFKLTAQHAMLSDVGSSATANSVQVDIATYEEWVGPTSTVRVADGMNVPAMERDIQSIVNSLPCQSLLELEEWPETLHPDRYATLLSQTEGFPMDEMRRHVCDLQLGLNRPIPSQDFDDGFEQWLDHSGHH